MGGIVLTNPVRNCRHREGKDWSGGGGLCIEVKRGGTPGRVPVFEAKPNKVGS